jgi:tRNA threonylcarbamoyladenosine biosynthesis protein TsaE
MSPGLGLGKSHWLPSAGATGKTSPMAAPQPRSEILSFELPDEAATARLARSLAALARKGDTIALFGTLGSGKTAFARAFINALPLLEPAPPSGMPEPEEVPSPTFTLLQAYARAPATVWHFDLYRLQRPDEAYELGFEEALIEGIVLIEWPERLGPLLPDERLELRFEFAERNEARRVALIGTGAWARRLRHLEPPWGGA